VSKRHLVRSTGVIGFATAVSRVLGFVRDMVIAGFFGTAVYAQAFVVAFRIPNLLRDLVGEGAMNAAFVPVFTGELTKNGKRSFFLLAQVMFNIMVAVLIILTLAGIAAAPLIVKLIAPGFTDDPAKFGITVTLTRAMFPFLLLVGLWAYAMGLLNSLGKFASSAFGPCLLNISVILCAAWFGENVFGLASGVIMGGALQLAIQLPQLYASGWRPRLTLEFAHPQARKIGVLLVPRALGACVYQVNVFVSTILASLSSIVGEGAVAALYYANRIWQLPLAVFGIALAQAVLPAMARHAALNDTAKLKEYLAFSLKVLFFMLIPSSVGLIVLSAPIVRALFERGAFGAYSTMITSQALLYYAVGLVACGGIKVLVSAFYALHDTITPVKTALMSLAINVVLNIAFMWHLKVGGLALATSISAAFNFAALYIMLVKRIGDFGTRAIAASFMRVLAASAVMAACLVFFTRFCPFGPAQLVAAIMAGMAAFFAAAFVFDVRELKEAFEWISKRR
jgi:putative peptidoglycan lipid II flippase